jgi:hypothetical protein
MNFVPDENAIESDDRMSYPDPRWCAGRPVRMRRPVSRGDQVLSDRSQQMRRIGLAMCVVSATVTVLSAALIAVRL